MKHEIWTIAYRCRLEYETLLDNTRREFRIIQNTWRYWCADPHLFEYEGRSYVFAELYDRVLRRGVIGCCEIRDDGKVTPWEVVLKMPFHLSYPHVFSCDGRVFMIPESYVGEEIAVYEATRFPTEWKKVRVLKDHYVAVDSTPFSRSGNDWMLTLCFHQEHEYLHLYRVADGNLAGEPLIVSADDQNKRPGGKLFSVGDELIRPAQDCTGSYGCALNFYRVDAVEPGKFEESLIRKIKPEEIQSDFSGIPDGVHTYNLNEKYEVIDLKSYETDVLFYIMRPVWFIWRRVRRILKK